MSEPFVFEDVPVVAPSIVHWVCPVCGEWHEGPTDFVTMMATDHTRNTHPPAPQPTEEP